MNLSQMNGPAGKQALHCLLYSFDQSIDLVFGVCLCHAEKSTIF